MAKKPNTPKINPNELFSFKDKLVLTFSKDELSGLPERLILECAKEKTSTVKPLNDSEKKLISLVLISKGIDVKGDLKNYLKEIADIDEDLAYRLKNEGKSTTYLTFSASEFKKKIIKTFTKKQNNQK
ncbi:MAG: hypothetical protein ACTSQY_00005 [Candidatus Odinarchaeia archaeon]|nr:MAG: portal protein [Lokiarchaeota virus Fenrir Meg22_1012]URC17178.1 MAG: portal protein [Lokiarchaeota virus Fenrir Meg22_1214]